MTDAGSSADNYVEVYDEPDHKTCLVNEFVFVYQVRLKPGCNTLWHRHKQDTVYFSLSNARAGEQFPVAESVVTDVPCGAAVSRPHRLEPLIHKVSNCGDEAFHLIGAEIHQRPTQVHATTLELVGHTQVFESDRVRVLRIDMSTQAAITYPAYGLLVTQTPGAPPTSNDNSPPAFNPGDVAWLNAGDKLTFPAGFGGFFAQWL